MARKLDDLLALYAKRGLADWKMASTQEKTRARACLTRIAETEYHVSRTLRTTYTGANSEKLYFIPMPQHPGSRDFERSFLLPIRKEVNGDIELSFDVFMLIRESNCLAFRFEQAHPQGQTHDYSHFQMSRVLLEKSLSVTTPSWIPVSYPAFPTRVSSALETFLYIATAMHGYSGGVLTVLKAIFVEAGRPQHAVEYFALLERMLR